MIIIMIIIPLPHSTAVKPANFDSDTDTVNGRAVLVNVIGWNLIL
jgi:hypothetical protein